MSARQAYRLSAGGAIDRAATLRFAFDGRFYSAHPGDTLASALVANGVKLVGRSFKYHRPRGILTAGVEEPNALVELGTGAKREPNTKATTVELYDGLVAHSQNRWPSLAFDALAINSLLSSVFVAGFYYKTFMWPRSFWEKVYEPAIRRAAGLGRAAREADPARYEKIHAYCDVLVIGSGPAGLAAALAAAKAGARVILCEEDFALGGRLLSERLQIDGKPARAWAAAVEAELARYPEVRVMRRTSVFGVYDSGTYGAVERVTDHLAAPAPHLPRQRLWRIVARRAILAAGAIEQPIAFGANDRPGIMTASAVRSYVNRFAAAPGHRVALFTATDDGWKSVADLAAAGIRVAAVIDSRAEIADAHTRLAKDMGAQLFAGGRVVGTRGARALSAIEIETARGSATLAVDCLAVSGGWAPALGLTCHLGAKPRWSPEIGAFVPDQVPPGMSVAGAAAGHLSLAGALADGMNEGAAAARACGFNARAEGLPSCSDESVASVPLHVVPNARAKSFVDFQHDVTVEDVGLAHREGYRAVEHLKRYTTLGMGTDQGKTSSLAGIAVMAERTGRAIPEVGTTSFRPPQVPVALGALAGHHRGKELQPARLTPSHGWASGRGAVLVEAGLWYRAQWYPEAGETDWLVSVNREVLTVRRAVGVCDVSTLGKIDIQGTDAAPFLDRVYINTFSTLPVGKARYGVMLREDGFVMDDGTTSRLGLDRYFMTTTTANAGPVMQHLEFCRQVLWPELDVQLASVTDQWAQYSIAGPRARDVVAKLVGADTDVSDQALPHLGARTAFVLGGVEALLFRISFSGERAYEIAVPASHGDALIRAIMAAGKEYGIMPYGTEALTALRVEKGHVATAELNGQITARDLGLGKLMSTKKDYIGRRLAERPALIDPKRPSLVGVRPVDPSARLWAGAHFLPLNAAIEARNDQGHLTSAAYSPTCSHWIGLGLLEGGVARIGERIRGFDGVRDSILELEVCAPVFVDPEGSRYRG
jgi:sarcosine oxidase subunit alpha